MRRGWWPLLLLWLGLSALLLWQRSRLGLDAPLGPDAALWGLSAMGLARGLWPHGAPLYPALVALMPGPAWWWGGAVSAVLFAAVPPATIAVLLRRGVAGWLAAPVGLLVLLVPQLVVMGIHLQPDALTQLLLVGVVAAGLRWEDRPDGWRTAAWLGAALLLALTREHGVIVLPVLALALLRARGLPWSVLAALAAAGALLVWWGGDALPARLRTPLQSSPLGAGRYPLPEYMTHFRGEKGRPLVEAWNAGESLHFWGLIVGALVRQSAWALAVVAVGAAGFVRARRYSGLVALSPALAILFFWSQERHSAVLVPAALVGAGLLLHTLPRRALQVAGLLGVGVLLGWTLPDAPRTLSRAQGAARHSADLWVLAGRIRQEVGAEGWLLAGLENEANLYLGWPRHVPVLPQGCGQQTWDAAGWSSVWIAPSGLLPPPMMEIAAAGHMSASILPSSEVGGRPCANRRLPEGPLYVRGNHEALLEPACEAPVRSEDLRGLPTCTGRR